MKRIPLALLLLALLAGPAAALEPVDEPDVCLDCHGDLSDQRSRPHVHTAFAAGRCSDCHNPHASDHAGLLADAEGALCLSCHESIGAPAPTGHAPVESGRCLACHEAHAGDHAGQLRRPAFRLCGECHAQVPGWADAPVVHAPVDEGECATCHDPHRSDHAKLLTETVPGLCFECHDRDADFAATHGGRPVADADCTTCHDPHAATRPGLLHQHEHRPYQGGDCSTCHDDPAAFAVSDVQRLCLRCHREQTAELAKPYTHNLEHEGSCAQCHNAHMSGEEALLAAKPAVLCNRCHFNEPERGDKADWVTHDGMDCTECHVPHGSSEPRYLKTAGTELCAGCHARAHSVSHPVGPEVIDPRTGRSVTCLSCHQMHGAPYPQYLPLEPGRDLCILCHKR